MKMCLCFAVADSTSTVLIMSDRVCQHHGKAAERIESMAHTVIQQHMRLPEPYLSNIDHNHGDLQEQNIEASYPSLAGSNSPDDKGNLFNSFHI